MKPTSKYRASGLQQVYLRALLSEAFGARYSLPYVVHQNLLHEMPRAEAAELIDHLVQAKERGWTAATVAAPKYGYVVLVGTGGARLRPATRDELRASLAAIPEGKTARALGQIQVAEGTAYVTGETDEGRTATLA